MRRDFLNGAAVVAGASIAGMLLPGATWADSKDAIALQDQPGYYPPALTGLRGSHRGSFEAAHSLRDGKSEKAFGRPSDTGETYDLVIVGGGVLLARATPGRPNPYSRQSR